MEYKNCVGCKVTYQSKPMYDFFGSEYVEYYKLKSGDWICDRCIQSIIDDRKDD